MREEIAIQRPAALHKLPGIYSGQQHCHQGDPFREYFPAHKIYQCHRARGDQYHRQTHRYRVESEQFDKGDHAIGKENAHLTVSPGSKMNRQKSTISVGSVF